MNRPRRVWVFTGICAAVTSTSLFLLRAQEAAELAVEHANCSYFAEDREHFAPRTPETEAALSRLTEQVTDALQYSTTFVPGGSRTKGFEQRSGLIDSHIYGTLELQGVRAAGPASDTEFIRRVTLDMTGRIPTAERVQTFLADTAADKKAKLIDELLAAPEWVDKWAMFFGDLYLNNSRNQQMQRFADGRNAFHNWIKSSLQANKPYNQMATELIAATGTNSYQQGQINWIVGGFVTGGPVQDIFDQQTVNVAETFLGLGHLNCILCHNGRGHLEPLSLWGRSATRNQAWRMSAFLSRTALVRTPVQASNPNIYYWSVADSRNVNYQLNTTTGNRPARQPVAGVNTIAPEYLFSGRGPASGENFRVALAREVTADIQFSRTIVNYIWKEFFGRGIVEPANQFDPARLDPDNPPTALNEDGQPWPLQPSHPRLLNQLAAGFVENRFDLKWLMRQIANSSAYQMSARYDGTWNPNWEKLFARKLVRRLWAEEIHDAIAQSSGVLPNYNLGAFGTVQYAMQFPETLGVPGGTVTNFLDSFLRGNRDDQERRVDGSPQQALNLMNDSFVLNRIRATGTNAHRLLRSLATNTDDQLVTSLYLGILSRPPSAAEREAALASLRTGTRSQKAEDLVWTLYNKVDFLFNY